MSTKAEKIVAQGRAFTIGQSQGNRHLIGPTELEALLTAKKLLAELVSEVEWLRRPETDSARAYTNRSVDNIIRRAKEVV